MSTCRQIIQSALRRSGVIGANTSMNSTQANTGLERLKELYTNGMSTGLFGRLTDFRLASGNYTALEWQRITKVSSGSVVTIPTFYDMNNNAGNPNDYGFAGAQISSANEQTGGGITKASDGHTRAPLDGAVVIVIDASVNPYTSQTYLYDAQTGWITLEGLTLTSYAPWSGKYEGNLKNLLGMDLCDEYGLQPSAILTRNAARARLAFASKYDQPRAPGRVEYM